MGMRFHFPDDRQAQSLVEYALILALAALVLLPGIAMFRRAGGDAVRLATGETPTDTQVYSASEASTADPAALDEQSEAAAIPPVRTYYVDATVGSDANDGLSPATAWRSLGKVRAWAFDPGDSILLKRGAFWRERLVIPSSGTSEQPITFGAYGSGALPRISGADVVTGWSEAARNVWTASLSISPYQVFLDGRRGAKEASRAKLNASGEWYWEPNALYVYSKADPQDAFAGQGVEASVRDCVFAWARSHVRIEELHLTRGKYGMYLG
ncbi:MAG: hypothetical protein QGH74_06520 [Candidatus Brocadiia bacterium]|nr:hypothetical protein [Candidatus Brocadiia bacterium]